MRLLALLPLVSLVRSTPVLPTREIGDIIPGKFIVVLKPGSSESALNAAIAALPGAPDHIYRISGQVSGEFNGFATSLTDALVGTLLAFPDVAYVEPDTVVRTNGIVTQPNVPYGLARISHKTTGTNYGTSYVYDDSAGSGTCAYIIDTGVSPTHPEFEGRASMLANFIGGGFVDENGHGTHVSGTVGSKTYGVAKKAKIYGVKVLGADGSGSASAVLAGMDFAASDAAKARKDGRCPKGTVSNMSLGTSAKVQAINDAAKSLVNSGVFLAVAAGNSGLPAQNSSPASEPSACTVAASDKNNVQATFSNFGSLVDVYAPGVGVLSTWLNGGTATLSGTSMSSPHVAGLGAYLLGLGTTPASSKASTQLCTYIKSLSIKNAVKNTLGFPVLFTPNNLAYNGNGA